MLLFDGSELEGVALRAVEDARRLQLAHLAVCANARAANQSNVCASRGAGLKRGTAQEQVAAHQRGELKRVAAVVEQLCTRHAKQGGWG